MAVIYTHSRQAADDALRRDEPGRHRRDISQMKLHFAAAALPMGWRKPAAAECLPRRPTSASQL